MIMDITNRVRDEKLTARMNELYYRDKLRWARGIDRALRITTFVLSSGAAGSLLVNAPLWASAAVAILAAVVAAVSSVMDYSKQVEKFSKLLVQHLVLRFESERVLDRAACGADNKDLQEAFDRVRSLKEAAERQADDYATASDLEPFYQRVIDEEGRD